MPPETDYVERYSRPADLDSVTAYVLGFCHNSRYFNDREPGLKFRTVLCACICMVPEAVYDVETSDFTSFPDVKKSSQFHSLCPFWDKYELLRVGGRLGNSLLRYERESFISSHLQGLHLTELKVRTQHQELLHAGPHYKRAWLRQEYWIPRGRQEIRSPWYIFLPYFKKREVACQELMYLLQVAPVQTARLFLNCGVDYAGQVYAKQVSPRSKIRVKYYVAIFIC